MKKTDRALLNNNKGISSVETIVLMVIMINLVYYSFGFFGVVHTAVIHNIHARTYAFETFRHRTNLYYFRENITSNQHYYNIGVRMHGIQHETEQQNQRPTERPISMGFGLDEQNRTVATHNEQIQEQIATGDRNEAIEVNPVWVMVLYSLCLNATCGGG